MQKIHKMPGIDGKHLKVRFLMQFRARPPTFYMFVNDKRLFTDNFARYVRNSLTKEFGFEGVPLRLMVRDSR
jgi:GTP-binding protein